MKPFCGYVNEIWGSKGGREQRGSKQVAWIESFLRIQGLFQGFRAFSGIWGLFGDSGPFWGFSAFFGDLRPFSGIRGLFGDSGPFSGICGLFRGFAAFLGIRGLFGDSQPFRRFAAFSQIHGQQGERRERTSHLATLSLPDIFVLVCGRRNLYPYKKPQIPLMSHEFLLL